MANHGDEVFVHCLLVSLTRPREARSYLLVLLPKNLPEGPSCFKVRNRAGLVLGQLAGLRLSVRVVRWPMLVQALVNPTMTPGLPVLCRAVSLIVGGIISVSVGKNLCSHLKACSELPPRTSPPQKLRTALGARAVAFERRHRPVGGTSWRPECGGKSRAVQQVRGLRSVRALAVGYYTVLL